jgi:iron-sulfur cluster assembly accessory protein
MEVQMVTLTEKAGAKVKEILESEKKAGLRIYVSGGGCSGFSYGMSLEDIALADDNVIEAHGVKVFVDPQSAKMLAGIEVDYVDSLQGSGFSIKNPNAKSSCGCGHSFSA